MERVPGSLEEISCTPRTAHRFPGKLGLQQRVLPAYRAPFFEALAASCQRGLSVFAGEAREGENIPQASELKIAQSVRADNWHIFSVQSPFYRCYQAGQVHWLEAWQPDALVVEALDARGVEGRVGGLGVAEVTFHDIRAADADLSDGTDGQRKCGGRLEYGQETTNKAAVRRRGFGWHVDTYHDTQGGRPWFRERRRRQTRGPWRHAGQAEQAVA